MPCRVSPLPPSEVSQQTGRSSFKLQRCTLTTLTALQSGTSTRRTLVVQLRLLYRVMNPTKLGMQKTNYKVLPKLLQMWEYLQTPIRHHQSKRDPLDMQQKRADIQRVGNGVSNVLETSFKSSHLNHK